MFDIYYKDWYVHNLSFLKKYNAFHGCNDIILYYAYTVQD